MKTALLEVQADWLLNLSWNTWLSKSHIFSSSKIYKQCDKKLRELKAPRIKSDFYEAPIVPKLLRTIDAVAVKLIGCNALIG